MKISKTISFSDVSKTEHTINALTLKVSKQRLEKKSPPTEILTLNLLIK